ncbi:ABC transporter ATP-binding protein [Gorillibacterium sp. sgz500922]|uniref:ABC transporter ATP-binding protein n=1 Tax=Gorillibacterium sp. sgz500922 TaxID=3446694 RepID=UPI003F673A64
MPSETKQLLHRLARLLLPFRRQIIVLFATLLASSGIHLILPLLNKQMMDQGLLKHDMGTVAVYCLYTILLLLADQTIGLLETKNLSYVNSMFHYSLKSLAFKHSLKLKLDYFNQKNATEIIGTVSMDAANLSRLCDRGIFSLLTQFIRLIGGAIGLFLIDWRLTLVVLFFMPLRYLATRYLARKRKKLMEELIEYSRSYSAWYGEVLSGIKEVKLWGLYSEKTGQFTNLQRKLIKTNIKMAFIDKWNEYADSLLLQLITNVLYILGAYLVFGSSLTIGGLFAFMTYSIYVVAPISSLINVKYLFADILPSARRFFEFLDTETEQQAPLFQAKREIAQEPLTGRISFHNVSFSYGNDASILVHASFQIHPGELVVFTGANGSGKSTILNLLARFYAPQKGEILLDGVNIQDMKLKVYRRLVAVSSQEAFLFDATIEENVAGGLRLREHQVRKALDDSAAASFVEELPLTVKSRVGRNGSGLSGGQKQKIAMARAFAKDAPILLLDEATSGYDAESECLLNERLGLLKQSGKTILVVSHKPESVKHADRFFRVENGTVSEYQRQPLPI